jgi:CHAT domain-containing protein
LKGLAVRPQLKFTACLISAMLLAAAPAAGQSFVPPPRTIADITAILDQEKPDPARLARMQADAEREPPKDAAAAALVAFYYDRAVARQNLGRFQDSIADCKAGIAAGHGQDIDVTPLRQLLGFQYDWAGDIKQSLDVFEGIARDSDRPGRQGYLFNAYRWLSLLHMLSGDLERAQVFLEKNEALFEQAKQWPEFTSRKGLYLAQIEYSRGRLFDARGKLAGAEAAYRRSELLFTEVLERNKTPTRWAVEVVRDNMIASQGVVKARQGKFAEAEADVRRALLSRLASAGKYSLTTATLVLPRFAEILLDQGRYGEAEKLTRVQLDIYQTLGIAKETYYFALAMNRLASLLTMQGQWSEAAQTYEAVDEVTQGWEPARKIRLTPNLGRVFTLYHTNRVPQGIAEAKQLAVRDESVFGADHIITAFARGALAVGLQRAGDVVQAMAEFRRAIPIVLSAQRSSDNDDAFIAAAREQRTRTLVESYLALLAVDADGATKSFQLADAIRSQAVQKALAQSSARVMAGSSRLAELARHEQDLAKQIAAQLGILNNLLSMPSERRSAAMLAELQNHIEMLRSEHSDAHRQLAQEFPDYVALVDPKPPTVEEIKNVLKSDEVLLSYYFGKHESFVWAIGKEAPIAFARLPLSADDLSIQVNKLRAALEPQASIVSDIPPFDTRLAYELYTKLLQPVDSIWKKAKSLIVVTNGALGLLPLGLLPTAPVEVGASGPLFAAYRDQPWLARSHAVTVVPSISSLQTLRQLPPGSLHRQPFIGFGDPYFDEAQASEAEQEQAERPTVVAMRSGALASALPILRRSSPHTQEFDAADLALLPRLPDTAEELRSIARVLGTEPAEAVFLGKQANETAVKTIDLSRYRIVAFATHGLLPGDLDGLTQPALALTAPSIAGVPGDGLLTMEEILALKLDADWVVLSACNTAAGAGTGAEAASGLGRAFFYAGTRSVLVTNWSVHSASARELMTQLFRRQAADSQLSRAEALRHAMMALADGPGFTSAQGETLFSYAHPLFWAPYSIIGDGS